jgi:fatty-acyl-CoA synthase
MPVKAGDVTVVACPIFHSWGLGNTAIALGLGNPIVLRRKFDPEQALADVARHRARVLAVVPVMMQRMADLPEAVRLRYDVSSLRVVGASGSALPGDLATRFMDAFGDVIYNLYGSTEVGYVTVAGPTDLREAPGTAGRIVRGNEIELLDDDDRPVRQGKVGRIFIRGPLLFEGYTGGGDKTRVRGMMSTGDVGYFDSAGRLFVTGRDDEMIVSGGENVFPAEVEDLLASQPEIAEAAVIGVDDEKFGQRLAAYVVLRDDKSLDEKTVKDRVKQDLAGYKVPRDVHFVVALPRNDTGKVVKRELGKD